MITKEFFGNTRDGKAVTKYIFSNKNGFEIHLLSYGLTLQKILYPTPSSKQDIVLGFDDLKSYEENNLYIGCIVGRNANRLSNGTVFIENKEIQLSQNEFPKQLHGGIEGFNKKVWDCKISDNILTATYLSENGEEGFPGKLNTTITFELTDSNEFKMDMKATTNAATVVNLTRHDYFNLKDAGETDATEHLVQVNGEVYTPTDNNNLVTGEVLSVKDTLFDLQKPKKIKAQFEAYPKELKMGYDTNYGVNSSGKLKSVAIATDSKSGRTLEIFSTQPGIQFYTAAYLNKVKGKDGHVYDPFHGFCLETQHYPDATKHSHFKNTIITPDLPYTHNIIYKFTV